MPRVNLFLRRVYDGDNGVDIRRFKTAFGMIINNQLHRAAIKQKFLQPDAIAHIQPGIGADKGMDALRIEQAQCPDIKICVEIGLGIDFLFRWKGFRKIQPHHFLQIALVFFFIFNLAQRISDVFFLNVRRVADNDVKSFLFHEDFGKLNVPDQRLVLADILFLFQKFNNLVSSSLIFSLSKSMEDCFGFASSIPARDAVSPLFWCFKLKTACCFSSISV